MNCRLLILLTTLTGLFITGDVLAHNPGHVLVSGGPQLSGGVTMWGNSYGQSGYAGNLNPGFGYPPAITMVTRTPLPAGISWSTLMSMDILSDTSTVIAVATAEMPTETNTQGGIIRVIDRVCSTCQNTAAR